MKIGHHATKLIIGIILILIFNTLFPIGNFLVRMLVGAILLSSTLGLWYLLNKHNRLLCENCILKLPLNASEKAQRYRLRFRILHLFENSAAGVIYLAVVIASAVYSETVIGRWIWVGVQSTLIYLILAVSSHRSYQPWCLFCKGGGEDVSVDDPLPELSRS